MFRDAKKDAGLAKRIANGDREAFAQFVDLYGPRIQSLARRYAATSADAEDLTQEIFLGLYKSIGTFRGASTLSTWVYRVGLNYCLKHCQRRPPTAQALDELSAEAPADGGDPARCAATGELRDKVQTALSQLSPEHRDVVILHELQELTYGECADILRVPVGTVKSRLYYAFRALRSSLAGYVLGEPCVNDAGGGVATTGAAPETT